MSHSSGGAPSEWVARHRGCLPAGGEVLDVACGAGRHARFLLELGHPVTAVDRDVERLGALRGRAALTVVAADLEAGPWPFGGRRFPGVIVTNYLHRPLFGPLLASVAAGGCLIYETFAVGQERLGRPRRPEFLLRPGELLELVAPELTVLHYAHGRVRDADGTESMRQRVVAVRGDDG